MPVGGFTAAGGGDYEAKITPLVIISCIMAATGGLMFGYDIGISGTYMVPCMSRTEIKISRLNILSF